jgi:hypothetical protein
MQAIDTIYADQVEVGDLVHYLGDEFFVTKIEDEWEGDVCLIVITGDSLIDGDKVYYTVSEMVRFDILGA